MAKIARSVKNPYGLSIKQQLVLRDVVENIKRGGPISVTKSHMKFYDVKKKSTAAVMANENLNRPNFRNALYSMLEYEGVLGVSGKLEGVLTQGLDAHRVLENGEAIPDFDTRLRYIQEIVRVVGLY